MKLSIDSLKKEFLKNRIDRNNVIIIPVEVNIKKTYNQKSFIEYNWIIEVDRIIIKNEEWQILKYEKFLKFALESDEDCNDIINEFELNISHYKKQIENKLFDNFFYSLTDKIKETEKNKSHFQIDLDYDVKRLRELKMKEIGII